MKLRKLLLSLMVCTMLVGMMRNTVLAQASIEDNTKVNAVIDISDIELKEKVVLPDGAVLTQISFDEYVSILSEEKGISLQDAYKLESREGIRLLAGETIYYKYSKVVEYYENRSYSAKLLATIKIYTSGSFREIRGISGVGSRPNSGTHDYDWIEVYSWTDPYDSLDFPTTQVTIGATGYFEVRVSTTVGVGMDIPGFSAGVDYGGETIFTSNDVNLEGTYRVY